MQESKSLSRREFLQTSALATLAAGSILVGCDTDSKHTQSSTTLTIINSKHTRSNYANDYFKQWCENANFRLWRISN
ncbi:twin-arginine translocation signal domain-containing protein [uncultured Helicobacter sp.]|uniref:twin-arginine translocation signal domain-containing protein n=1 Tax=uncultured Helicobacter sp. TaxID=175537 RepID=UPI0025CBD75D|nr:twin-arginine translocation signal domain-containing protein [uncultured Helicobacter sp.]